MPVLTSAILSRFETVVAATAGSPRYGFRKAGNRFALEKEPEGGRDGVFRVEAINVNPTRQIFGTLETFRTLATVTVQLAYFRGGGSAGGYRGGDRKNLNKRVVDDIEALILTCEDSATYDSATTGIRVVRYASHGRLADLPKAEIWGINFDVEWQASMVMS